MAINDLVSDALTRVRNAGMRRLPVTTLVHSKSIEAVANICISLILVQYIGIYGVALGTAIPMLFNKLLLQPIYTCNQLDVSLKNYFYSVLKYISVGVVIFVPALLIIRYVELDSYLKLSVAGFLLSAMYVIVNMKFIISDKGNEYVMNMVSDRIKPFLRLIC